MLAKKLSPPHQNHFLKIQWEIYFLGRHFLGRNGPKKIRTVKKKVFRFDPGPWEVPEPEKHEICKYTYLPVFWFGHFPRFGIKSENSFLIKCYIISVRNLFFGAFRLKKWRSKKWISHCIFKK